MVSKVKNFKVKDYKNQRYGKSSWFDCKLTILCQQFWFTFKLEDSYTFLCRCSSPSRIMDIKPINERSIMEKCPKKLRIISDLSQINDDERCKDRERKSVFID